MVFHFFHVQGIVENFPITCKALALEPWNYCSGEQAQHSQHCIIFMQLNYVYELKQNKVLPPYDNPLCHKVTHFLFFN